MKSRSGFVSNSSSSSFVIAAKSKLTDESLMGLFKIPEESPMYYLNSSLASVLISCSEQTTVEDIEDSYWNDWKPIKKLRELEQKGYFIYEGRVSNEDSSVEELLCDSELMVDTEDLYIYKEAGY